MQQSKTSEIDPRQPSGSGVGCWLTGFTSLLVAAVLIGVGLLLPPFNLYSRFLGPQFTMLDSGAPTVAVDGLMLAADSGDVGENFGVAVESVPMQTFLAGDTRAGEWIPAAMASSPPTMALQSPVYHLRTTGSAPDSLLLTLSIPTNLSNPDLLNLYGYQDGEWHFLPSITENNSRVARLDSVPEHVALFQAVPLSQSRVVVAVDVTQILSPEVGELATIVAPAGLQPTLDGRLTGSLAAGFDVNAGYLVMPVIRNYSDPRAIDPETVAAILGSATLRAEHALHVAAFASAGYDGVMIDYRDLSPEQRENFTLFIDELGQRMHEAGLLLGVVVPAAEGRETGWETGAYDWRALGQAVDLLQVNLPHDPTLFAPEGEVDSMIRWAVGEVSREKLLLGLSALSSRQVGEAFTPIGFDEALSALGDVEIDADTTSAGTLNPGALVQARLDGFQAATGVDGGQVFIDYLSENSTAISRMWLTTPDALHARMDKTLPLALGGVAFEDLLADGVADGVLETILSYKLQLPPQSDAPSLALRWTIASADGVIGQATTGLNEGLVATIEAPDGNYAINVEVVHGDQAQTQRGGASLAVFAPTATPTPLPTSTPTPTLAPTFTPNPQAIAAAQQPAEGQASGALPVTGAAIAPGAGSIAVGSFEYGGHVTSTNSEVAANALRSAGGNWMKVQIQYGRGAGPGIAQEAISGAHSRGFKVLLGIVGNPGELGAGGMGYIQEFASFLGGVAALGPDAIEIWNEPNIEREWPNGQISGQFYFEMLRAGYNAIKSTNGSVMVISAAPAPTGAEAAFPGAVVNDDRFLRDLVAAGGLNYMDCLGAHYNEGITPPSAFGGDPRDNYYTRYFWGMVNTYWGITGGQKPICFTELGFLTPEGYGGLPGFFSWAQNVTVAQQAAWLAEAAALSSQSGKVRLMIVWNVDFTAYGSDPQAGYAMIRPGGGCPACSALAGAR